MSLFRLCAFFGAGVAVAAGGIAAVNYHWSPEAIQRHIQQGNLYQAQRVLHRNVENVTPEIRETACRALLKTCATNACDTTLWCMDDVVRWLECADVENFVPEYRTLLQSKSSAQ